MEAQGDMQLDIDVRKCWKCGACVRECPAAALKLDPTPVIAEKGEERCIHCQHCLAVCPTGALSIFHMDPLKSNYVEHTANPAHLISLMRNRRSIRNFKQENVEPEKIAQLMRALDYAPSGCNDHSLRFILIDKLEVMNQFRAELTAAVQKGIREHNPAAAWLGPYAKGILRGQDIIFRSAPHLLIAVARKDAPCPTVDPIIALSHFDLLAQAMNIGTTWCGIIAGTLCGLAPELAKKIGFTDQEQMGYAMLFGYPAVKFHRITQPKPLACHSVALDELLAEQ